MSSRRWIRPGGLAIFTGGALEAALWVLMPTLGERSLDSADPFVFQILILLGTIAAILLPAGLAGLYARLALEGRGRMVRSLARAGLVLAIVSALTSVVSLAQVVTVGLVSKGSFLSGVVYPVGLWALPVAAGLLGVSALVSRAMGAWGALPLILCPLMLAGAPGLVIGACWMLLGYALFSGKGAAKVASPAPARHE